MKKSDRGGLEPSATTTESTDAGNGVELIADGGISRRFLLGAAAALSSLPAGDNTTAAGGGDPDGRCRASKRTDIDYDREKVADTPGGLELYVGMDEESETCVTVSSHREGVGLRLSNEIGAMSVLLLPEDIEPLCRELLDARKKTHPDDVEYSREWITEDYRESEADAGE